MLTRDDLFAIAFQYKAAKPWKKLWDTDLFAVRLPDGETGYVSVMGRGGEHCAIGLYVGDAGFLSYRTIMTMEHDDDAHPFRYHERLMGQNCLQLILDDRDELTDKEYDAAKEYASRHGIRFAGANAFPHFVRYETARYPWPISSGTDTASLYAAAEATLALSDMLKTKSAAELGIRRMNDAIHKVPLMEQVDGRYVFTGHATLPDPVVTYPAPTVNELTARRVRKLPVDGEWQCEVVCVPEALQDEEGQVPYFPYLLMCVRAGGHQMLSTQLVQDYRGDIDEMAEFFLGAFLKEKIRPAALVARDERTRVLLAPIAKAIGAGLTVSDDLPELVDAQQDFFSAVLNGMDGGGRQDEYDQLLILMDDILESTDEELATMPEQLRAAIKGLIENGVLPDDLARAVKKKLKLK